MGVVDDGMVANTVASGHGEVREGGEEDDEGCNDVIQTLGLGVVVSLSATAAMKHGLLSLTVGTLQPRPVKTTPETSMMMKTTLACMLADAIVTML